MAIALIDILQMLLWVLSWIVIGQVIISWLYAFNVINSSNQFVNSVGMFLYNVTEPVLRPIRRFMPNLGGIDISPLVVILIIASARIVLRNNLPY